MIRQDEVFILLMVLDMGTTIINLAILAMAIKLYTDQTKQRIFKDMNSKQGDQPQWTISKKSVKTSQR